MIRGAKLRAMMTSALRDLDLNDLKELCLEELEGMSRKRIRCILRGEGFNCFAGVQVLELKIIYIQGRR